MTKGELPTIPYGAVYFRKSNPPRADWERDYGVAAADGHNIFRHWFMWSAIEVRPGVFDWDDYDRQLDLAAKNGIRTIIAEMITATPEWLYLDRPEGRYLRANGEPHGPHMGGSSATGGFHGMCLDDEVVRERAGNFLRELAGRYKDHPAMAGYDIWNECNYRPDTGYAQSTILAFRRWLQQRYQSIEELGRAWGRYSLVDWESVTPPSRIEIYADSFDWLEFLQDNAYEHMQWRIDTLRSVDTKNLITAHGIAAALHGAALRGTDDWRAASKVEIYGFTWVASRQGDKPYQHLHAVDLTRAASRGKPFWHAEAQAGPLWLQPQVTGRPLDDGRVTKAEDVRIWNMTTFAGGARGLLYPRWRPLLDGPLFGAFGAYGMDGSRTPRSEMASKIAKWANEAAQAGLWQSRPVRGEVGLLFVLEAQTLDLTLNGDTKHYTDAIRGAYQGFFENNIQADFVHIDDIDQYDTLYLPHPIMLKAATAKRIVDWVEKGGTLICEGLPAYFGDRAHVGATQPNHGLDTLFGARESDVVFAPDLYGDLRLDVLGHLIEGGVYRQSYAPSGGTAVGWYDDGAVAAVENTSGKGRTLLIGTYPSVGFGRHHSEGGRAFFRRLLSWAGREPIVTSSNRHVTARLHEGEGGRYLWVLNHTRQDMQTTLSLGANPKGVKALWGAADATEIGAHGIDARIPARDVLVLKLD